MGVRSFDDAERRQSGIETQATEIHEGHTKAPIPRKGRQRRDRAAFAGPDKGRPPSGAVLVIAPTQQTSLAEQQRRRRPGAGEAAADRQLPFEIYLRSRS
jgi:hypothetical protein